MYSLANAELQVSVLDPIADRERFGTRYCTGGYIFQVADARHGDLLSGPTYPGSFNVFDGQGLPEAFNLSPLRSAAGADALALLIGIGICDLKQNKVYEWCDWRVEANATSMHMATQHAFRGFEVELQRTVTLTGRTVRSQTRVKSLAGWLPIRWFPHPFFPQPATDELCKLNVPVRFPENPGYKMAANGYICRQGWPWQEGFFQPLDHEAETPLIVVQKHPKVGLVVATCSYAPAFFPIWGNANTFSWEPFLEITLATGQEKTWWIDYDF
jgi:hypothetical protein